MSKYLFNYSSVVVDDITRSADVYRKIGAHDVWEGEHPFFRTRGVICATQKGGALLLEQKSEAHPAIAAFEGEKERNFHIGLVVDDIESQRALCEKSPHVREVSDTYGGPTGKSFVARLSAGNDHNFWIEFTGGLENLAGDSRSSFECVDSTAMVAESRDDLLKPFESIGLLSDKAASDGYFDVLEGINVVVLMDWHYLEINEPTKADGVMTNFLRRLGRPGIFGTNFVPKDMSKFVEVARENQIDTNTEKPILLNVRVRGTEYRCAKIITINPRATGGARIFILEPLEYPWRLVA